VWRCHIDLSSPNPDTMSRLLPYVDPYPAAVFHMRKYVPANMDGRGHIVPPAIDPLAPQNMAFSPEDAVRPQFLPPRLLCDWLELFEQLEV
jgi:trehalose synthase